MLTPGCLVRICPRGQIANAHKPPQARQQHSGHLLPGATMKPCASCKTTTACAKAGKCGAKPMAMPKNGSKTPADKKKSGRFY